MNFLELHMSLWNKTLTRSCIIIIIVIVQVVLWGPLLFVIRALCLVLLVLFSYPFAKLALASLSEEVRNEDVPC